METFFEILLALFLMSYVIRKITPYIIAYFLRRLEKKVRSKFNQNNSESFKSPPNSNDNKKEKVGEYVDFEEIRLNLYLNEKLFNSFSVYNSISINFCYLLLSRFIW